MSVFKLRRLMPRNTAILLIITIFVPTRFNFLIYEERIDVCTRFLNTSFKNKGVLITFTGKYSNANTSWLLHSVIGDDLLCSRRRSCRRIIRIIFALGGLGRFGVTGVCRFRWKIITSVSFSIAAALQFCDCICSQCSAPVTACIIFI